MSSSSSSDWSQRGIKLSNTIHSEVAPCLPLPSLPPFCGAVDQELRLFDDQLTRPLNRPEILAQAGKIADLLRHTDVSYLNLKHDATSSAASGSAMDRMDLCDEVLRYNPDAFECTPPVCDFVVERGLQAKAIISFPLRSPKRH